MLQIAVRVYVYFSSQLHDATRSTIVKVLMALNACGNWYAEATRLLIPCFYVACGDVLCAELTQLRRDAIGLDIAIVKRRYQETTAEWRFLASHLKRALEWTLLASIVDWLFYFWVNQIRYDAPGTIAWSIEDVFVILLVIGGNLRLRFAHNAVVLCSAHLPDEEKAVETLALQLKFRELVKSDQNDTFVRVSLLGIDTLDWAGLAMLAGYLVYYVLANKRAFMDYVGSPEPDGDDYRHI